MENVEQFMIVVYGPTGVGKTAFVDQLTQIIPSEIVNADMGQFYKPLTIGTAKPDWQQHAVPHYLFDILTTPEFFTVVAYRALVKETMQKIWQQHKIPILVGGSAFYVRSLFFPPVSAQTDQIVETDEDLWEQLHAIDPERAKKINKKDTYRIKRALALFKETGTSPSEFVPQYDPPANYLLVCLTRDREDLYARINERVYEMLQSGWIAEVEALQDTEWESFIMQKKIIGYDDILRYLKEKNKDFNQLVATIQQRTRNYAKRQMSFWRMLKRQLENALSQPTVNRSRCALVELNLTCGDLRLYINQLQETIQSLLR